MLQVGALANAVGIGGGAFFVPLFNILLGFSASILQRQYGLLQQHGHFECDRCMWCGQMQICCQARP